MLAPNCRHPNSWTGIYLHLDSRRADVRGGRGRGPGLGQLDDHAASQQHAGRRGQPERAVVGRRAEVDPLRVRRDNVLSPGQQPDAVDPGGRGDDGLGVLRHVSRQPALSRPIPTVAATAPRQNNGEDRRGPIEQGEAAHALEAGPSSPASSAWAEAPRPACCQIQAAAGESGAASTSARQDSPATAVSAPGT